MENLGTVVDFSLDKDDFVGKHPPIVRVRVNGIAEPIDLMVPNPFDNKCNRLHSKAVTALLCLKEYAKEFEDVTVARSHLNKTIERLELHVELIEKNQD